MTIDGGLRVPTILEFADEIERLATNASMSAFAPMDVRRRIVADQLITAH